MSSASSVGSFPPDLRRAEKIGCFSENTKVAVSEGLKPWIPREREKRVRISSTGLYSGARMSSRLPDCKAPVKAFKKLSDSVRNSGSLIKSARRVGAESWCCSHSRRISFPCLSRAFVIEVVIVGTRVRSLEHHRATPSTQWSVKFDHRGTP